MLPGLAKDDPIKQLNSRGATFDDGRQNTQCGIDRLEMGKATALLFARGVSFSFALSMIPSVPSL